MRVILIRHAESSWNRSGQSDFERSLNDAGRKAAPIMGQKLNGHEIVIDRILSSPSKRTAQTAKLICKEISFEYSAVAFENSMYNGDTEDLLEIIHDSDDNAQCIVLIAHNPGITYLANLLQKDSDIANMPPCSIISISFSLGEWSSVGESNGTLDFFDYPKGDL